MSPTLPSIEPMSLYQFTYIYQDRSWKYKNHQKANPTKKMPQNKMKSQKKKKKSDQEILYTVYKRCKQIK